MRRCCARQMRCVCQQGSRKEARGSAFVIAYIGLQTVMFVIFFIMPARIMVIDMRKVVLHGVRDAGQHDQQGKKGADIYGAQL